LITVFSLLVATFVLFGSDVEAEDSCVDCHRNPDFMVTNKKLYDYFQLWVASPHGQEDVTCSDCHDGDPEAADKQAAHAKMRASGGSPGTVSFRDVPKLCGECHEDNYSAYMKSKHFKHLVKKSQEDQGPNCVTCHGSVSARALDVNTVRETCVHCHNKESDNHPDIPQKAEGLLNDLNTIRAFTRFIGIRGDAKDIEFSRKVLQPETDDLATTWHTFDLKNIEPATSQLLTKAKDKRSEMKLKRPARKEASQPTR
jgi:hypothetical protein